jgi:hypothetical protein
MVLILASVVVYPARADDTGIGYDLAQVRRATAAYHDITTAEAAGYNLLSFYNFCVANPEFGAMGYHYINVSLVDNNVDPLHPEAMVYLPGDSGELELTSVEYIVWAGPWNATHPQPPAIFGETFGYNAALGVYSLHAWVWRPNPSGMFSSWNPKLSCD